MIRGDTGIFITLEGGDGAGKSTQVENLYRRLLAGGKKVIVTREPGGTCGAEAIRRILLEGEPDRWSGMTEVLLFCAARSDHMERVIRPALEHGTVVLCDRFHDSTEVYQAAAGGVDPRTVRKIHEMSIGRSPDLTLVLLLDPMTAAARCDGRAGGHHRFEKLNEDFRRRVEAGYRDLCKREPGRCRAIDANASEDAVAASIWEAVAPFLHRSEA